MQGKGTPASTDFEDVIVRSQPQFTADPIELLDLGLFERVVGMLVDRARIDHIAIQEQAEEIVAQIVVRLNIAAAAHDRIAIHPMAQPVKETVGERKKRVAAFQFRKITCGQTHDGHWVRRRPVAVHIGISGGIVATPQHSREETFVVYGDRSP